MTIKTLEKQLIKKHNDCLNAKIYISWGEFLKVAYETASCKQQYNKCSLIQDLIIKDINS